LLLDREAVITGSRLSLAALTRPERQGSDVATAVYFFFMPFAASHMITLPFLRTHCYTCPRGQSDLACPPAAQRDVPVSPLTAMGSQTCRRQAF